MIIGANRVGKTCTATIRLFLGGKYSSFPMDPNWPIFKEYGVKWRPYSQPQSLAMCTSSETGLKETIYPKMYRYWIPESEVGCHATANRVAKRNEIPSWGHDASAVMNCGSRTCFYTYNQDVKMYQGSVHNTMLWDETPKESLYNEADERCRTVGGDMIFSLTPVCEQGRTDTGSGSFIYKMAKGLSTKGRRVKVYSSPIHMQPDFLYPESEKITAIVKHQILPTKENNNIALAEGRARLFGEFHIASNRVLTEWNPQFSFIDPLWKDYAPSDMTLYRSLDYGVNRASAALWFAVDKESNIFIYREFYRAGKLINEDVSEIVKMSGNKLNELGKEHMGGNSQLWGKRFEEVYEKEGYAKTILDSRSFGSMDKNTGKTSGDLYRMAGLKIMPASGQPSIFWIPIVQSLLHVDSNLKHIVSGKLGASKIYVFNTLVNFKREIEGYVYEVNNNEKSDLSEKPRKKDDHLISCFIKKTKVLTKDGNKNIEDIKIGDEVKSNNLYNIVSHTSNRCADVSLYRVNGRYLICTDRHKIWVNSKMVEIGEVCKLLKEETKEGLLKKLSLTEEHIEDTHIVKTIDTLHVNQDTLKMGTGVYIKTCGKKSLGKYQRDIASTIKISAISAISTTLYLISKLLKLRNIIQCIVKRVGKNILNPLMLLEEKQRNWKISEGATGIKLQMEYNKVLKTGWYSKLYGKLVHILLLPVVFVRSYIKLKRELPIELMLPNQNIVQETVIPKQEGILVWMILSLYAKYAELLSRETSIQNRQLVVEDAALLSNTNLWDTQLEQLRSIDYTHITNLPVYNLTVENEHNYFANNILVSNCLAYACQIPMRYQGNAFSAPYNSQSKIDERYMQPKKDTRGPDWLRSKQKQDTHDSLGYRRIT
jgi:hypothetical protein